MIKAQYLFSSKKLEVSVICQRNLHLKSSLLCLNEMKMMVGILLLFLFHFDKNDGIVVHLYVLKKVTKQHTGIYRFHEICKAYRESSLNYNIRPFYILPVQSCHVR